MSKVVVFGSMNMDLSIAVRRVPNAGETVLGPDFVSNAGGKGANQAVAAARLGADVRMIAAVGADPFGDELVRGLEAAGVDCAHVRRLTGVSTGIAVILRSGGDNRIVVVGGANLALAARDVTDDLRALGKPGDVLVVQGECDERATLAALRAARARGLSTILNAAPARPLPDAAWDDVDLVCVNETECEVMCGILPEDDASCERAASRLLEMGAGAAVITLGSRGSFGMCRAVGASGDAGGPGAVGETVRVPAVPADAVDTTGAGDTFVGALAAGHVRGLSLRESMEWGSAAASLAVRRLGAQQAIPTEAEVAALMARLARGEEGR